MIKYIEWLLNLFSTSISVRLRRDIKKNFYFYFLHERLVHTITSRIITFNSFFINLGVIFAGAVINLNTILLLICNSLISIKKFIEWSYSNFLISLFSITAPSPVDRKVFIIPITDSKFSYSYKYRTQKRFTHNWPLIKQSTLPDGPYQLAIKALKQKSIITAELINNILKSSGISFSQERLNELLKIPRLKFINLNKETIKSEDFLEFIGTVRDEKCSGGVYIWTHLPSGNKYVGSSSFLARRLIGYFKGTHASIGKFIPFLYNKMEDLNTFTLEVIPIKENYEKYLELFLEQYFLLHTEFNLNTLRVANKISGGRSKPLFIYDINYNLIYSANNQEEVIFGLNIHYNTIRQCIETGEAFLKKYYFMETLKSDTLSSAPESLLSLEDLFTLFEKERLDNLNKLGRKVIVKSESGEIKIFNSIKDCLVFLNTKGSSNKTTLYRYIESGKPYHGFICEWGSEEAKPLLDKGIEVAISNAETGETIILPTLRKAALWFSPVTTGQTIKSYIDKKKLFRDKYYLSYNKK